MDDVVSDQHMKRQLGFLLIGATKSGTTSLYECFRHHPEVVVTRIKEPHFFSQGLFGTNYHSVGREITDEEMYWSLFPPSQPGQLLADFDPLTMHGPRAVELLQQLSPATKIVMVLRNPIERAYSHYRMDIKECLEQRSLLEAISGDLHLYRTDPNSYCPLIRLGFYAKQVAAFIGAFGRRNVHVCLYDDLVADSRKTTKGICDFLGIGHESLVNLPSVRENYSGAPRSMVSALWLRSRKGPLRSAKSVYRHMPSSFKRLYRDRFLFMPVLNTPLPHRAHAQLKEIYREDILELGQLLGLDLTSWLRDPELYSVARDPARAKECATTKSLSGRPVIWRQSFRSVKGFYGAKFLETASPVLRLAAKALVNREVSSPEKWTRGVILGSHHIGDVLWRTNSLEQLKRFNPTCEWHYLCSPGAAQVLQDNPNLTSVIPVYQGNKSRLNLSDYRRLRGMRFDVALCTNKYNYANDLALSLMLGIPNRVSYVYKGLSNVVTHPIPIEFPQPYPAYFRDFVAHFTGSVGDWSINPKVYLTERHKAEARAFASSHKVDDRRPYVIIFNTAITSRSVVPGHILVTTMDKLYEEQGYQLILAGSPADKPALADWANAVRCPIALSAGEVSLMGMAALMANAHAVLSPDSGPRHLANAVGCPVLFLRAMDSQDGKEVGVYCDTESDLFAGLAVPDVVGQQERLRPDNIIAALKKVAGRGDQARAL